MLVDLERRDGGVVHVAEQKYMDRAVPIARELVPGHCSPETILISTVVRPPA